MLELAALTGLYTKLPKDKSEIITGYKKSC